MKGIPKTRRFDPAVLRRLAGMSVREIAAALGGQEEMWRRRMVRLGIPRLEAKARPDHNYFWKGGRIQDQDGYWLVRSPDHPYCTQGGYVREHRLVMERELGRHLLPEEVVDHIDGNTGNNYLSNLRVFPSNGAHLAATLKGRCPDWTEAGKERLRSAAQRKVETADAMIDLQLESGAPLSRGQRARLRAGLRRGRLSPSRTALWQAWSVGHPG